MNNKENKSLRLIDLHCDTLGRLLQEKTGSGNGEVQGNQDLKQNDWSISIPGMQKAGTLVQFFACFTCLPQVEGGYDGCYDQALAMMELLREQCSRYPEDLGQAFTYEDIQTNEKAGKISAVLTVEEGGILNGKMERLEELHRQGVRLITPMWNYENCFGYPNSRDEKVMNSGLKAFGKEAVEYAGNLGIIVDVSHASDGTFRDILDCASGPVVASHSNCRALCDHPRNLTDDMIRKLAEAGGVAGLNLYGMFLGGKAESRLEEMVAHVQHMIQVGGSDFPAIGTDLDGFDGMEREDIPRMEYMERLESALRKAGLKESQIEKLWRGNAERILRFLH